MFGAMQVAKRIPFDDNPDYINYARAGYVAVQLLCLAMYYYCSMRVKKANDLTVIKYVNAKNPMSQEPGELVTTTNRDYDLAEISKATRGILMGCAMVGFMHLYLGYTNPLVIQSILPLKNALESNMAKLWVWGQPATGDRAAALIRHMQPGGLGIQRHRLAQRVVVAGRHGGTVRAAAAHVLEIQAQ